MCCISGGFAKPGRFLDNDFLLSMLHRGTVRGRDAYGFAGFDENNAVNVYRGAGTPDNSLRIKGIYDCFIANNRAEPTTEHLEHIDLDNDIQPYIYGNWAVVHNGVIANDKELCDKYLLSRSSKVDSSILPKLLDKAFPNKCTPKQVFDFLQSEIVGSFAFAVYNTKEKFLLLMCNYQPIYIRSYAGIFYFASLPEVLEERNFLDNVTTNDFKVTAVPPYSAISFQDDEVETYEMERKKNNKCLVICSGGLDSTVASAMLQKQGYDITLIHFLYKCKAQTKETEAVQKVAEALKAPLVYFPIDFFKDLIGGSTLFEEDDKSFAHEDKGVEYAYEWVPARNMVFTALATAYAEAHGFSYLALGTNLEEQGAYPDNSIEFTRYINKTMSYCLQNGGYIKILTPLEGMMKHDIYKKGREINAPIQYSWSCYDNKECHCGVCGPCTMRKLSAKMCGVEDNIKYLK